MHDHGYGYGLDDLNGWGYARYGGRRVRVWDYACPDFGIPPAPTTPPMAQAVGPQPKITSRQWPRNKKQVDQQTRRRRRDQNKRAGATRTQQRKVAKGKR